LSIDGLSERGNRFFNLNGVQLAALPFRVVFSALPMLCRELDQSSDTLKDHIYAAIYRIKLFVTTRAESPRATLA
jgi:hypothetical protein